MCTLRNSFVRIVWQVEHLANCPKLASYSPPTQSTQSGREALLFVNPLLLCLCWVRLFLFLRTSMGFSRSAQLGKREARRPSRFARASASRARAIQEAPRMPGHALRVQVPRQLGSDGPSHTTRFQKIRRALVRQDQNNGALHGNTSRPIAMSSAASANSAGAQALSPPETWMAAFTWVSDSHDSRCILLVDAYTLHSEAKEIAQTGFRKSLQKAKAKAKAKAKQKQKQKQKQSKAKAKA